MHLKGVTTVNFDYTYEETAGRAFVDFISENKIAVIAIAVVVVLIIAVVVLLIMIKNGKIQLLQRNTVISSNGYVFCPKCYNKYYLVSNKCPYCKQRRLRY